MILSLLAYIPAHGLSVVQRSFDELVDLSDVVLVGTVKEVRSEFADGGLDQNTIISYVSFAELEIIKGEVDTTEYALRVPGGVVGRFAQAYPGVPAFQTGQRYLVFIRGNHRDFFPVVGIAQGVFRVITNDRGQPVVVRADRVSNANQRSLTTTIQNAPSLDDFIKSIHNRMTSVAPMSKSKQQ